MFLRNAWYVAAWDSELTHKLLAATILGDRLVLYRTASGDPVALEDACPHRKLPLSMGRIIGDEIECGYHGLVFDAAGHCTRVPGGQRIPPGARVRSYPTVARFGMIWIWMGDAERADSDRIFPVEHWDDPAWTRNRGGSMLVDCNYLYITDNLLDPSHVAWVHRGSFGNADAEDTPVQTITADDGVTAARWMLDVEVAPFYSPMVRFQGRCDRLQHYEVRFPSHAIIKAIFTPAGSGGSGKPISRDAMVMDSYNFMTPVDEDHTRYFWFQACSGAQLDQRQSELIDQSVTAAFHEDRVILEAVHRGFKHEVSPHINLAIDRASVMFRQRLRQLIAGEQPAPA